MVRVVPIEELREQHEAWMRKMAAAAEEWVHARAAGLPTDHYSRAMREAERNTRRLERRMRRRRRDR